MFNNNNIVKQVFKYDVAIPVKVRTFKNYSLLQYYNISCVGIQQLWRTIVVNLFTRARSKKHLSFTAKKLPFFSSYIRIPERCCVAYGKRIREGHNHV
jgi:hypothetical protein